MHTSRFTLAIVCGVILLPVAASAQPAPGAARPNIVLIFADDLGWKDVGYQGSDFHETPNLDALAKQGMVFTNAYAGAGNCAPSRACLLSGQYTPRHGVYAVGDTNRGPKNLMRMIPIPNKSGLAPAQVTMADALKDAGYTTGIFGKWHLGGKDGTPPDEQGFDTVFDSRAEPEREARRARRPEGRVLAHEGRVRVHRSEQGQAVLRVPPAPRDPLALEARPETLEEVSGEEGRARSTRTRCTPRACTTSMTPSACS